MKLIAFSLLLAATVACTTATSTDQTSASSNSSITTTGATNDVRICSSECGWRERCGTQTFDTCMASCQGRYVNNGDRLREEYVANAETCFPSLSCSDIDDKCLERWGVTKTVPEMDKCLARSAFCGSRFTKGICYAIPALVDDARDDARACLNLECEKIHSCVQNALGVKP